LLKIAEGNRGEIFLNNGKVVKRYKKNKPNYAKKEAAFLNYLQSFNLAPKLFEVGKDYIVMEYLGSFSLKEAIKVDRMKALLLGLEASYRLDRLGVYHQELGRYHHFLYSLDLSWVRVIDFERAKWSSSPRNLFQFVGFYLREVELAKEIKMYKKTPEKGYFAIRSKVLRCIKES